MLYACISLMSKKAEIKEAIEIPSPLKYDW